MRKISSYQTIWEERWIVDPDDQESRKGKNQILVACGQKTQKLYDVEIGSDHKAEKIEEGLSWAISSCSKISETILNSLNN